VKTTDIVWKFRGLPISTSNVLSLPNIKPSASGEYECIVKNVVGTKTTSFNVVVHCKLSIITFFNFVILTFSVKIRGKKTIKENSPALRLSSKN
jgi:hypothetical protein